MSEKVQKPRLGYYKALLSQENPDLDKIIDAFIYWSKFVEYLIFRKENIYTYEKEYKAVKAAKRGNDVYSWKLKKRLMEDVYSKFMDCSSFALSEEASRTLYEETRRIMEYSDINEFTRLFS